MDSQTKFYCMHWDKKSEWAFIWILPTKTYAMPNKWKCFGGYYLTQTMERKFAIDNYSQELYSVDQQQNIFSIWEMGLLSHSIWQNVLISKGESFPWANTIIIYLPTVPCSLSMGRLGTHNLFVKGNCKHKLWTVYNFYFMWRYCMHQKSLLFDNNKVKIHNNLYINVHISTYLSSCRCRGVMSDMYHYQ